MAHDASPTRANDADTPDAELLSRGAAGEGRAFGVLVRRYVQSATSLALELVGNRDDAEDVVQEAFLVALDRAAVFDPMRPFGAWLHGIVRHKAMRLRVRAARRRRLLRLFGWPESPPPSGDREDASMTVAKAAALVQTLPEMQRRCFDLHVGRGLPTAEVAAQCGIAESTVRQHIFRARTALRRALADGRLA